MSWTSEYSIINGTLNHLSPPLECMNRLWNKCGHICKPYKSCQNYGKRHRYLYLEMSPRDKALQNGEIKTVSLSQVSGPCYVFGMPLSLNFPRHRNCTVTALKVLQFFCTEVNQIYPSFLRSLLNFKQQSPN